MSFHRSLTRLIPELSSTSYKGQCGKLGVCGGSAKYAGAPYFAAMSALRMGTDLSTIFCTHEAAVPIKSFSPDLMVQGTFMETAHASHISRDKAISQAVTHVSEWLPKLHVLIMGPGLGTDSLVLDAIERIITTARTMNLPIILDGDAIRVICNNPDLIRGYTHATITPNAMEFKRLWDALKPSDDTPPMSLPMDDTYQRLIRDAKDPMGGELDIESEIAKHTVQLARSLGGVTIVRKGSIDVISNGKQALYCSQPGSNRRVGGQGDVLAGAIGTFTAWTNLAISKASEKQKDDKNIPTTNNDKQDEKSIPAIEKQVTGIDIAPSLLAALGGCTVARTAGRHAFAKYRRSMLASHVIDEIQRVMEEMFPEKSPDTSSHTLNQGQIPAKI